MKLQFPTIGNRRVSPISAALAMAVFAIAPAGLRAATQYGAGAFTWDNSTTAAWSSTTGGPYTSQWTSGNDAVLEGTAGTLTLSSPTVENIRFNTTAFILSGASTLTLTGTTPTLFLGSGITATIGNNTASVLGGSVGLTKDGLGTLTLNPNAVSTFTGGLAVKAGTLTANLSNLATPTDLINNGNALTLAGGTLGLTGKGSAVTSQTFASTTVNSGGSIVTLTQNSATSLTAALGGVTRNAGGTLNFSVVPATSGVIATTSNTNETSGILGPWASVGTGTSLQYGTVNGSNQIVTYAGATTTAQAANLSDVTSASVNYAFGATVTPTQTGNITGNTLRYTGATAGTLANGGYTTTLNGLMNAGSAGLTVSGVGNFVIGANKELVIIANGQNTTISASTAPFTKIVDNGAGASSLVYSGAGSTLTLNCATNTYSGGTVINSGSVTTLASGNTTDTPFGTGSVTINPGATLALNKTYVPNNLTLNNATVTSGNSFSSTLPAGYTITLNGINTFSVSGGLAINGNMTGSGGWIKSNTTVGLPVTGSNNYTGPTTISAGGLSFLPQALYGGSSSSWTPANITVASGATLGLYFSDTGTLNGAADFRSADVNTLLANLTTGIYNNGLKAGAFVAFDGSHGNGTYSGTIADSAGTGGGSIGVNKIGGNTLTLSGNNTFTGAASVGGPSGTSGGTLRVYSFNYITSGTLSPNTSSSLGHPTTVANGTINCGNQSSNQAVGLTYLGTGETTDRVLVMNAGVNGTALTLDQSGTGLLKFTSNISTPTSGGNNRILVLQGSTAGTGEIAGSITNVSATAYTGVTKSGTGTWTLSGANTYAPVSSAGGLTTINGGCLVLGSATALPGGIAATGGTSPLTFNGGVLGLGVGNFNRPLAAAGTATGVNFTGAGGWAAYGADRVVNLGGASATVTWATASTGLNAKTLILGNATADHMVDFQNPLDLGSTAETVQVDKGTASIDGKLSGNITGLAAGNLTKSGAGTLALTGSNNYAGTTTVSAGTLLVNGTNSGTGLVTAASGATLGGTGTLAGAATFSTGAKAVFTVTRDAGTGLNTTPLTITGVMAYNSTVVHINAPLNLPSGTYTLATSSATPTGTVTTTPILDSGSYAAGFTSAVVSLDTINNKLLLTVNGLPTTPTALAITSINGGTSPTAGLPFSVVVQSVDANGVVRNVTSDTSVSLTLATGTGSLFGTQIGTITAGSNSVTISGVQYSTAESGVEITATASGGDSLTPVTSAPFTVIPDTTPTSLTVTGFPALQTAGVAGDVTVTAKTPGGAVATSYVGTVHFTSNDTQAVLPANYTFVPGDNGVHVFPGGVTLKTAGTTQSITATDTVTPSITGTESAITVLPAAPATMTVSGFPSPHAQSVAASVTVSLKDAYNNPATNYTGTVHFTSSDGSATLPGDYTFVSGDQGTHTFSNGVTFATLGTNQSITATDSFYSVTGTQSGIIVWVPPTSFTWTNAAGGNWSVPTNWTPYQSISYAPPTAGEADYTLNFGTGTYSATNDLSNGFLVNQLNFSGTVTLGGGNAIALTANGGTLPTINQNSVSTVTVTAPLTLDADTTVGGTGNGLVTLVNSINGTGALIRNGAATGTLNLSAANTYSGGTTVMTGTLSVGSQGNSIFGTGAVTMNTGTTLNLNGNGNLTNTFILKGAVVSNGNGYSANLNGPVQLSGTVTLDTSASGQMSVGGVISNVSGFTGSLTKTGTGGGPLYLYNANTYSGATSINGGSIILGSAGSIIDTSSLTITAGASFDVSAKTAPYAWSASTTLIASGTGTIAGVTAARIVGPAAGHVDLSLAPGIQLTFSPLFITGDTTHPALHISQGALTLNNNAFTVTNAGPALGAGVYRLIQVGDGSTGVITENATPSYAVTVGGNGLVSGCSATVSVSSGNVIMTVVADPYLPWIETYFPTPNDPNAAKDADPDGDGQNNLEEFAFNGNPTSGAASGKVRSHVATIGSDQVLVLTLPVRGTSPSPVFTGSPALSATSDHVKYTIEGSLDLTTFDQVVTEVTPAESDMPVTTDPGWSYRTFRLNAPITGANPKGFLRVIVEPEP